MARRSLGGVSITDMSRRPRNDMCSVRGMGVALLVFDSEALLLIDDHEAEIPELDVFRKQAVGADGDVDFALGEIRYRSLQLLGRAKAAKHLHADREGLEAAFEGFEMLKY